MMGMMQKIRDWFLEELKEDEKIAEIRKESFGEKTIGVNSVINIDEKSNEESSCGKDDCGCYK